MPSILCPTCHHRHEVAEEYLFDWAAGSVSTKQGEARLRPIQADILFALIEKTPRTMTYEALYDRVYSFRSAPAPKTLQAHMHYLRQRITPLGLHIATVHGFGYRFEGYKDPDPIEVPRFIPPQRHKPTPLREAS